jgi:peptidyl-prolyl cis-trans isomerase C
MMSLFSKLVVVLMVCGFSGVVIAQSKVNAEAKVGVDGIAKVGRATISTEKYEQTLKSEIQKGRADTPQLREEIRNTLINQELLMQEVSRQGVDKKPEHREAISQLRQNYLVEALFRENLAANPVTDQDLKAAYDKEYKAKSGNSFEYKIKELAYNNEKDAMQALQRLKKGEAFDKLWTELPASNKKSAETWIPQQRLVPTISNVIVYINKGSHSLNPVQVGSRWLLIKVDDVRPYKSPEFEQVKSAIYANLVQKRNVELMQKIRGATPVSILAK